MATEPEDKNEVIYESSHYVLELPHFAYLCNVNLLARVIEKSINRLIGFKPALNGRGPSEGKFN